MKSVCLIGFGSTVSVPLLLGKDFECYVVNDTPDEGGHLQTLVAEVTEVQMTGQPSHWEKPNLRKWRPEDIKKVAQRFEITDIVDEDGIRVGTRKTLYIPVETGTEFIGTKDFYPVTHREFDALGIKTQHYNLAVELDNLKDDSADVLLGGTTCNSCSGIFTKKTIDHKALRKKITSLRAELMTFLVSECAKQIQENQRTVPTLDEFLERFITNGICFSQTDRRLFVESKLYPELMASYGVSRAKVGTFTANDVLNYIVVGTQGWEEIVTGLSTYNYRVAQEREKLGNTYFVPPQKAAKLETCTRSNGERCYKVKLADGSYVLEKGTNQPKLFDFVLLGTNAEVMRDLLPDQGDEKIEALKAALGKATYYTSPTEFYAGEKPADTRVYIPYDPEKDVACLNRSKPDLYPEGAPVVRNIWMAPGVTEQSKDSKNPILPPAKDKLNFSIPNFRHMDLDNNFRDAQHAAQKFQAECAATHRIMIGGVVGGFNDSTESAKQANVRAVWAIRKVAGVMEVPEYLQKVMPIAPQNPTKFEGKQLGADPDVNAAPCEMCCSL